MRQRFILLMFFFFSIGYSFGQIFKIDSTIIYQNQTDVKVNPYIDSINLIREQYIAFHIDFKECPDYFFVNKTDKISLTEKINELNINHSDTLEYIACCQIYVDWQGVVREIKLAGYKGLVDINELKLFFKGLQADKVEVFGFGVDSECNVIIKKYKK